MSGITVTRSPARNPLTSFPISLGAGTIGILTALTAKVAGAGEIVVTDLFDLNLKVTKALCGARTYSFKKDRLEDTLLVDCPDKFDITFLCSGAPRTWSKPSG